MWKQIVHHFLYDICYGYGNYCLASLCRTIPSCQWRNLFCNSFACIIHATFIFKNSVRLFHSGKNLLWEVQNSSTSTWSQINRGSMTTFTQYLFYASISYIIFTIFFVITYVVFALITYFLAASAKYEWDRYQRYRRIREVPEQRYSEPVIVRNENGNV